MSVSEKIVELASKELYLTDITSDNYKTMKYPKLIPMMKFKVQQYKVEGFGNLMIMDTNGMGGMMKLSTIVFTPSEGASLPFLLIDTMDMKKKHLSYVEYYDCTAKGAELPGSNELKDKYADIPDYDEKQAWYIARRTPYALIKGGDEVDEKALTWMTLDCAKSYIEAIKASVASADSASADSASADSASADSASANSASADSASANSASANSASANSDTATLQADLSSTAAANIAGLKAFQTDMLEKGNPSSETLEKVLGKDSAATFFKTVIMPV